MSGRIDSDIDGLFFRTVLNEMKQSINLLLSGKDYGPGIENWDVIMVIYREAGEPTIKYSAKKRETDIEMPVDHAGFKEQNLKKGKRLFYNALILSLNLLKAGKKVKDFDFDAVITDISDLALTETT